MQSKTGKYEKRRLSGREKTLPIYNENFYCDYECGFSTKVLSTMTNHLKRRHSNETAHGNGANTDNPSRQCSSESFSHMRPKKHQVLGIQEKAKNMDIDTILISSDSENSLKDFEGF